MRCRFVSLWTVHVNLMTLLWVSVKHIWTKFRERESIHASGLMLNSVVLFIYIFNHIYAHCFIFAANLRSTFCWDMTCVEHHLELNHQVFGLWFYWLQWLQWLQNHCDKPVCPCYIDFFLPFRNAGMHCTRCVSSCHHHGPIIPKPFIETLAKQYFTFVITTPSCFQSFRDIYYVSTRFIYIYIQL